VGLGSFEREAGILGKRETETEGNFLQKVRKITKREPNKGKIVLGNHFSRIVLAVLQKDSLRFRNKKRPDFRPAQLWRTKFPDAAPQTYASLNTHRTLRFCITNEATISKLGNWCSHQNWGQRKDGCPGLVIVL